MNGQKFVYKFVAFPEITKTETKIPFSVKMGRMATDDGSTNRDGEEENGNPPSPTLSNSPPSMVVSKSELQDNYYRCYMQECQANESLAKAVEQPNSKYLNATQGSHVAANVKSNVTASHAPRDYCYSPSSAMRDVWRPRDGMDEKSARGKADVSALSSSANEERARNAAATAVLWAGLQQMSASSSKGTSSDLDSKLTFKYIISCLAMG